MPEVTIRYSEKVPVGALSIICEHLPNIVAEVLGVAGTDAALIPQDVEVLPPAPFGIGGHNTPDLSIRIEANDYPERRMILTGSSRRISDHLLLTGLVSLTGIRASVWIRLAPADFHTSTT